MKKLAIFVCALLLSLSSNSYAVSIHTEMPPNFATVLGVDINDDGKIAPTTVQIGQDGFIAEEISPAMLENANPTIIENSFKASNGKIYLALSSIDQLRVMDADHDNIIDFHDPVFFKLAIVTYQTDDSLVITKLTDAHINGVKLFSKPSTEFILQRVDGGVIKGKEVHLDQ
jgi:hypothetical protein